MKATKSKSLSLATDSKLTKDYDSSVNDIVGFTDRISKRASSIITSCRKSFARASFSSDNIREMKQKKAVKQLFKTIPIHSTKGNCNHDLRESVLEYASTASAVKLSCYKLRKLYLLHKTRASFDDGWMRSSSPLAETPVPRHTNPVMAIMSSPELETERTTVPHELKADDDFQKALVQEDSNEPNETKTPPHVPELANSAHERQMMAELEHSLVGHRFGGSSETSADSPREESCNSQSMDANSELHESLSSPEQDKPRRPDDLRLEIDSNPVVMRDTNRLSPKALTREISPVIDGLIEREESRESLLDEPKSKTYKSIFESDSEDEDLFAPVPKMKSDVSMEAGSLKDEKVEVTNVDGITEKITTSSNNSVNDTAPEVKNKKIAFKSDTRNKITSLFDDSSDDDFLFNTNLKPAKAVQENTNQLESKLREEVEKPMKQLAMQPSNSKKHSLFSDSSDGDENDLFKSSSKSFVTSNNTGSLKKIPGKLDVGEIGGRLNSLLLAGGPRKPTTAPVNDEGSNAKPASEAASASNNEGNRIINVLRERPRGPKRRPPSRLQPSNKPSVEDSEPTVKNQ